MFQESCCIDDEVSTAVKIEIEENTEENSSRLKQESVNANK